MFKPQLILILSFAIINILLVSPSSALNLSRNLPTSIRDMEYFYQHQKVEALPGILRTLERERKFAKGELRLTTAAFLSEIFKQDPKTGADILARGEKVSLDAQKMLLWAVHLSNNDKLDDLSQKLASSHDSRLKSHIGGSSPNLLDWPILKSPAVLNMYWGAFFAYANQKYLDAIIDAAILHASLKRKGLIQDPQYNSSMAVCASLYEMAPRHEVVRKRLAKRLENVDAGITDTLKVILDQKTSNR